MRMYRYLMTAMAGWLVGGVVVADTPLLTEQQLEQAARARDAALTSTLAWELLESLTTEVGPRMAGTEADARAVAWGKARFEALGFDRVSVEPVPFPRWVRGEESARITAPYQQPLVVTALGLSVGTPADGLRAEVIEFADYAALEAAADQSLDGRIAYISNRMRRTREGVGYGEAVVARSKGPAMAARKGASALLIRSIGTDSNRVAHTGGTRYEEGVAKIPAAALSNPDADLLSNAIARAGAVEVELHLDVGMQGEARSYNVIGDMLGAEKPEEYVLIGCHLDSWDVGTGAIDDGAGCALTMAAAKLIREQLGPTYRTLRVVLWANEEHGLIGAKAFQAARADTMRQNIIGTESDFGAGRIYQFSSKVKPEALAVIDQISQVLGPLGIVRGNNEASGGPDLIPMHIAGMAMARLHQDGTDYFDYHHTMNDTLDKVDPEALAQNVAAYVVFAYLTADYPGDFGFDLIPPPPPAP